MGGEIDKKNENTSSTPPSLSSDELVTLLDDFFSSLACPLYFLLFLCSLPLSLHSFSLCRCGNQKQSHSTFIWKNISEITCNSEAINSIRLWRKEDISRTQELLTLTRAGICCYCDSRSYFLAVQITFASHASTKTLTDQVMC